MNETTWQQAASEIIMNRYPGRVSPAGLLAELEERSGQVPSRELLLTWLSRREREGTIEHLSFRNWRASDAVMHPEKAGPARGCWRHATLGEVLELAECCTAMAAAALTVQPDGLRGAYEAAQGVISRVRARRDGSA